jgi:EAL domain-containing protein (putative c-di-GMP-specific phosphodiesterase class I)
VAAGQTDLRIILALVAVAVYALLFPVLRFSARALARGHAERAPGLQRELREAMRRGELVLHYQPKLDLATGEIPGVEALLRWQSPRRGTVPPGEFLPLVEDSALMDELTEHVAALAAAQLGAWNAAGVGLSIAVNISPRTLADPELPGRLAALLEAYGLPPSQMVLEVTETAVMEPVDERRPLEALVGRGFGIAIDDFGTGRSSLERLDRLPVDELKIDRAFIARMEETEDTTLVTAMIRLGHELGMRVVAEGAESRRTVELLRELGCDLVQGYAVSRPVPAATLRRWLDDREERSRRLMRTVHPSGE